MSVLLDSFSFTIVMDVIHYTCTVEDINFITYTHPPVLAM